MAEAAALIVLEIALAATLQKILTQPGLSEEEKAQQSFEAIEECLKNANDAGKRLFFDPAARKRLLWDVCHSVAIEEVHDCYFKQCDLQKKMGEISRGVLFAVYNRKGMGKSYGCLSLLVMKHSRAPRHGYYFSGATTFPTGDEYYNSLLDNCIGRRRRPSLSEFPSIFEPRSVADLIISSLPVGDEAAGCPPGRRGIRDIPGVRHYFDSQPRRPGGSPVVVFDDVNILLEMPSKPWDSEEDMKRDLFIRLGKAAVFFDMIMTMAHTLGVVVFVSTSNLLVAKFFHSLNDGTKARAFKPVVDNENLTCQEFGWTEEKRLEFLRLRVTQKKLEIRDEILRAQAHEAYCDGQNIREMDAGLAEAIGAIQLGTSEETIDDRSYWCSGCTIS